MEIVKPGDNVEIIGVVKQRWDPFGSQQDGNNMVELVLKAHNLSVQNHETCNIVDAEEAEEEFSKVEAGEPGRAREEQTDRQLLPRVGRTLHTQAR